VSSGIAIIEIEIADHRAVNEGGGFGREPIAKTQDAARKFARGFILRQSSADLRWLTVISA
jgi:hypothetical protein